MAERIITTELKILQAFMDGKHPEVTKLLRTMTHGEAKRYLTTLDDLVIRVDTYLMELEKKEEAKS